VAPARELCWGLLLQRTASQQHCHSGDHLYHLHVCPAQYLTCPQHPALLLLAWHVIAVLQSGLVLMQHVMALSLLSAWLLPEQAGGWLVLRMLRLLHLR
jgi:hypothetical protein